MQLTDLERYVFDTSGVLIRRNVVPIAVVESAIGLIQNRIQAKAWKFPTLKLGGIFWDWMCMDEIFQPVLEMCGPHCRLDHAFGVRGGVNSEAPAQLHGGPDSSQHSCFYHNVGKPVGLIGQLSVGVTLKGQSPVTGGFCYLPGSHKAIQHLDGNTIFREMFKYDQSHEAITVPTLNPGDLVFFSESLVHGDTGARTLGFERLMAYYKFTPGWMCWRDPDQQAPYRLMAKTERAKRLLEPPWTGRFDDADGVTMSTTNVRRKGTNE